MVHLSTKKHEKSTTQYSCEKCSYSTSHKGMWNRHIETKKHKDTQMVHNSEEKHQTGKRWECECGLSYKYHSGYYRHKSKCKHSSMNEKKEEWTEREIEMMKMFGSVIEIANHKLTTNLVDTLKETFATNGSVTCNGSNNVINNQKVFNVNVFLREQCANAMSIQEFAKNLQLTMDDFDKSKTECITNVVLNNLKPMSLTERPFHCTNISNAEWYINDREKGWGLEDGKRVIDTTEHAISQKWPTEFNKMHPGWSNNERHQERYVRCAGLASSKMNDREEGKVLQEISLSANLESLT